MFPPTWFTIYVWRYYLMDFAWPRYHLLHQSLVSPTTLQCVVKLPARFCEFLFGWIK